MEPYRQRVLMDKLQEMATQAFVTTHSPATISAAAKATLWYVDHEGHIGAIKGKVTEQHRARDPELFLSRIAIVAEGATECGAIRSLVGRALDGALAPHGVHVCQTASKRDPRSASKRDPLAEGVGRSSGALFAVLAA